MGSGEMDRNRATSYPGRQMCRPAEILTISTTPSRERRRPARAMYIRI